MATHIHIHVADSKKTKDKFWTSWYGSNTFYTSGGKTKSGKLVDAAAKKVGPKEFKAATKVDGKIVWERTFTNEDQARAAMTHSFNERQNMG